MSEIEIIVLIATILFGLVIGSFLNVVIYRIPLKESIAYPSSHCPKCNHQLSWYDNIPVISYLLLGGKCRYCHEPISSRYPLVELMNASLWVLALNFFGLSWLFVFACILISIFIAIAFIDIDHMIIPDSLNIGILMIAIISLFFPKFISNNEFSVSLLDKFLGFGIGILFLIIVILFEKLLKKEIMGGGDIKLIAAVGLFLGWQLTILGIVIGSFVGVLIEIPLRLIKLKEKDEALPFGPYLIIGFLISLFIGLDIIAWYLNLLKV